MAHVQLFLSCVSAEFRSYREMLRHALDRPNVTVKVQEDFIESGTPTLDKLDTYIRACDGVIHLLGDSTGSMAKPESVAVIREHFPDLAGSHPLTPCLQPEGTALSYTQWEAWLALLNDRKLFIAAPSDDAQREAGFQFDPAQRALQDAHRERLSQVERYPAVTFSSADELTREVRRGIAPCCLSTPKVRRPSTATWQVSVDLGC